MSRAALGTVCLLIFAACSSDTTPQGTGRDATTTSTAADAPPGGMDAIVGVDQGSIDTGLFDMGVRDTSVMDGGPGQQCTELAQCCPQLPQQSQGQCFTTAGGGDEGQCGQGLTLAQQAGYCVPGGTDAEPRDGPLGPSCALLAGCCAQAGQLQTICENTANSGDEARCDRILNLAAQFGLVCMAMDAGTSTISDAGTSTIGDAGTSTTGDAGP